MAVDSTAAREAPRPGRATPSRWLAALATRVNPVLVLLLGVALLAGLAWCIVLPALQGPDEISHFAYVQKIAETGRIPWHPANPANPGRAYSTEVAVAGECSGITGLAQNPAARAPTTALDERVCERQLRRLPAGSRSNGEFTSADKNPPLYYLYETVPYLLFHGSSFFTRAFAMRLANLPLMLALVLFVWLIAGELLLGLPRGQTLRAVATAAVALNPQLSMMTATINPDILLAALWTAGLWLSVVVVRHGATRSRVIWLVLLCVLAGFTQGRGLPLAPVAALALLAAVFRQLRPGGARAKGLVAASVLVGLAGAFLLLRYALRGDFAPSRVRQFGSYVWQFYLPRIGSMKPPIHPGFGIRQVFIDRFLGTFAQLEVVFSMSTLNFLSRAAEVTAVLVLVALVVHRRRVLRAPWVLGLLAFAALVYIAMLHAAAFTSLVELPSDPVITGRYLLPLLVLYGVGIALALSWLPRVVSQVLCGAVVGGLAVLQLGALGIVLERFYA